MTFTLLSRSAATTLNSPTIQHFPQGFTIIAEQVPVEAVNLSLWANVGSAVEPDRINGMAHFLEHMVFKGTDRLEIGEFERAIEERGAITNAATSQDYTHYYITTAPKDFAALAPLQLDVVFNPRIDEDAFEREKSVVLEEIRRSQDSPQRRSFQRAMEVAFEALPYRRPVLGSVEAIEALSAQQMRDFHGTWYQPSAMTAVAVGNLPVEELIDTVASSFLDVAGDSFSTAAPRFSIPQFGSANPEPAFGEIIRREYVDESIQQARLVMMWRVPGMMQLEKTYALDVLAAILGKGRTGRLIRQLREEEGLVSHIGAGNMSQRLQGIFQVSAQLPTENIATVEAKILDRIRALQTAPVLESELARIRTQVANRFIFGNETPSDRANLYGYFNATVGDLNPAIDYPQTIQSLDLDDLQRAAIEYLSPEAYGIVIIRPKN
ncbi:MAG TPA: insulinase family protein [Oscillatoriales cyanobacterium M59_W2019_021]|nr:insulinase family protein [Oscillatoriales cyanobacterium M4454_W2019_049]HIK53284.1 insulinase family protein [Oscillatoriales cyanobacterium M59_W2019_021]